MSNNSFLWLANWQSQGEVDCIALLSQCQPKNKFGLFIKLFIFAYFFPGKNVNKPNFPAKSCMTPRLVSSQSSSLDRHVLVPFKRVDLSFQWIYSGFVSFLSVKACAFRPVEVADLIICSWCVPEAKRRVNRRNGESYELANRRHGWRTWWWAGLGTVKSFWLGQWIWNRWSI